MTTKNPLNRVIQTFFNLDFIPVVFDQMRDGEVLLNKNATEQGRFGATALNRPCDGLPAIWLVYFGKR